MLCILTVNKEQKAESRISYLRFLFTDHCPLITVRPEGVR